MTCPRCHCPECRAAATPQLNRILRKHVERIDPIKTPDPDAEQLAREVVGEMVRCGG